MRLAPHQRTRLARSRARSRRPTRTAAALLASLAALGFAGGGRDDRAPEETSSYDDLAPGLRHLYETPMQSFRLSRDEFVGLWRQWPQGEERARAEQLARDPDGTPALQRLVADHYGLPLDPRRGNDVPAAFAAPPGEEAGVWTINCFACHGGSVEGRYFPGLANSGLLLEDFVRDVVASQRGLTPEESQSLRMGRQGHTIGLTEATFFGDALIRFREPNLDLKGTLEMAAAGLEVAGISLRHPEGLLALDAPAWWQLQHKTRLYLDHSVEKNHRTVMQFTLGLEDPAFPPEIRAVVVEGDASALSEHFGRSAVDEILEVRARHAAEGGRVEDPDAFLQDLTRAVTRMPLRAQLSIGCHLRPPGLTGETIRSWDANFEDIFAFIDGLEAPRYPGEIDRELADRGAALYHATCARCHGHHDGSGPGYASRRIDHDVIGTDALYPTALDQSFRDRLRGFLTERPDGSQVDVSSDEEADEGYVAPPLNGVWATAPYLHNGSIPTIDDLLDYESRVERIDAGAYAWTADPQSYDHERVGLAARFVGVDEADQRAGDHRVHDSRRRGAGADGHDFGEALSASERRAVVEYLKTL